jgi:hypothetical protein
MSKRCVQGIGRRGTCRPEKREVARRIRPPRLEEHPTPVRQEPRPEFSVLNLLGRVVVVAVGFGLALTGWMLAMSVFLVFIGFPLFVVGLAVKEVGLKGSR